MMNAPVAFACTSGYAHKCDIDRYRQILTYERWTPGPQRGNVPAMRFGSEPAERII